MPAASVDRQDQNLDQRGSRRRSCRSRWPRCRRRMRVRSRPACSAPAQRWIGAARDDKPERQAEEDDREAEHTARCSRLQVADRRVAMAMKNQIAGGQRDAMIAVRRGSALGRHAGSRRRAAGFDTLGDWRDVGHVPSSWSRGGRSVSVRRPVASSWRLGGRHRRHQRPHGESFVARFRYISL